MAKAAFWTVTDTQTRKRGEQTGLDTLVVHAVNDECWVLWVTTCSAEVNTLSTPPGEYGRKVKTQRN